MTTQGELTKNIRCRILSTVVNCGARAFREARVKIDELQSDAAERFGVSQATVSRWEAGECAPRSAERDAIEQAYDVDRGSWDEDVEDVDAVA